MRPYADRLMQHTVLLVFTILLMAFVHNRFGTIPSLLILVGFISLWKTYHKASQRARSRKIKALTAWLAATRRLEPKADMTLEAELGKLAGGNG